MEPRRLNCLICGLNRFELTQCENQFIELAKSYFRKKHELTEQQEAILEGIYNEKLRWAKLGLIKEKSIRKGLAREELTRSRNKLI